MSNETAYFASGCYWSKEYFFSKLDGVLETAVGFMGGHTEHPTYQQVCTKTTGHAETVQVVFDPEKISFDTLVKHFFNWHDPTIDRRGKGGQYRSAIFFTSTAQQRTANKVMEDLKNRGLKMVTEVEEAGPFWMADDRHQGYCEARDYEPKKRVEPLFDASSFQSRF